MNRSIPLITKENNMFTTILAIAFFVIFILPVLFRMLVGFLTFVLRFVFGFRKTFKPTYDKSYKATSSLGVPPGMVYESTSRRI